MQIAKKSKRGEFLFVHRGAIVVIETLSPAHHKTCCSTKKKIMRNQEEYGTKTSE